MTRPYDAVLTVDFETRWATQPTSWCTEAYTLTKLTTEEYIRSPLFYAFGMCVHELGSSRNPVWIDHDNIPAFLQSVDWTRTAVLSHNAMFDVGILSMIYGIKPAFILDSLSMARALRGVKAGNSLGALATAYGLPPKGDALYSTNGDYYLAPHTRPALIAYCAQDVRLCEDIFSRMLMGIGPDGNVTRPFPKPELRLIDMTLRMFTEPELELDPALLTQALSEDVNKLEAALARVGAQPSDLASNDRFAELLEKLGVEAPLKTSRTTGKPILALAKTDAMFQAMLNGDNEDVALVCEARLRVKSTGERTRAQRFLDIASRGRLPVPLNYFGAGTGRFSATGKINMQNLKRGSTLRRAVMAPQGYQIIAGDLSQIEPRVLAWLADYDELLDIFRAGGDPYATFGGPMFNAPGMTKESHPLLRQSAKSAMLGCFGATTLVLTQRGWVPIVDVQCTDTTWDGLEWTRHSGVVAQGEKEVWLGHGIQATSDHEILTGRGWVEWSAVLQDPSLFQSALSLANSHVSVGGDSTATEKQAGQPACSTLSCAAVADGREWCTGPTSSMGAAHAAERAPNKRPSRQDGRTKATTRSARTENTATGSWIAAVRSLFGVQTQKVRRILTTVVGVLAYTLRGWQTAPSSWHTLSHSMVGTTPSCNSTEKTTSAGTCPVTCASSRAASTWQTSVESRRAKLSSYDAASQPLKQRMQTYDIAMAGPRNRYTILTDAGPIIVHNCGYQLGWASFAGQLLVGFLGAPPQRYTKEDARQLGVTKDDVVRFLDNPDYVKRMGDIPHTCTELELLTHCLAAKAIIDKYRAAAAPIVAFWDLLGTLIEHSLYRGNEYVHKCLTFRKGEIVLANGMSLLYPDLQIEQTKNGAQFTYAAGDKRIKLYPGKVCNNVTQGTARIVMTDGMLRVQTRYPVKGTVHDELLALCPEQEVEEGKVWVKEQMIRTPKFLPGIPLNADVGAARRYGDAKV